MTDTITEWANSLTSEQYIRLIKIAHPLTPEEEAQFDDMTDEELLSALKA
jgi:hypothetical protein